MERVESTDGTRIALDRSGSGPPLVIVVGAFCDRADEQVARGAAHSSGYTVYEDDSRGRGARDHAVAFSLALEVVDMAGVVAAPGQTPLVYGHSSGGSLALEAAARGVEMRSLAVYEPPYTGDAHADEQFAGTTRRVRRGRAPRPGGGAICGDHRRATRCDRVDQERATVGAHGGARSHAVARRSAGQWRAGSDRAIRKDRSPRPCDRRRSQRAVGGIGRGHARPCSAARR